jgi:hypothetical protein
VFSVKVGCNFYFLCKSIVGRNYCNRCVLLLTHMLILNVCLTTSIHGLHTSMQHLDKTLEPLNWIRVCPSLCSEHAHKRSHVLHCVSCNISKYTTFNPHTRPSFHIYVCSTGSHLTIMLLILNASFCFICSALAHSHLYFGEIDPSSHFSFLVVKSLFCQNSASVMKRQWGKVVE